MAFFVRGDLRNLQCNAFIAVETYHGRINEPAPDGSAATSY